MTVRNILSTLALGALSASALLASGVIFASNSETVVRDSFASALNSVSAPGASERVARSAPVAGTEEYWLKSVASDGLPVTKTVAIGDHIGLKLRGEERHLEISSISEFAPEVTEIDTRVTPSRLVLVTARDTSGKDATPVRFVMEVEHSAPGAASQAARTL